jgi:hypothetical protein
MRDKTATALRLLNAAIKLLEEDGHTPRTRRAEWFGRSGHLSSVGITHLRSLFENGKSAYAAAKEMGITYRSAALWRRRFYPEEDEPDCIDSEKTFSLI